MLIDSRIYRAALVPAFLALLVLMFSLEGRPAPLGQELAADVLFEGRSAAAEAQRIAQRTAGARPGSAADRATAEEVRAALAGRGFAVAVDRFAPEGRPLVNVVGRRTGASRRQIVVMAPRDSALAPGAPASGADTAALLEVARVLEGRASRKTLVLASVDGSTLGEAGARRFLDVAPERDQIEAVLVLSNLAGATSGAPGVVAWSGDGSRGSLGLERTVASSLSLETGGPPPAEEGAFGQLVRLAAPLGVGAQGPLLAGGVDALRLSDGGELPPAPSAPAPIDPERLGDVGRAALRTVAALDGGGPPEHGPRSYVVLAGQLVPGWALATLALALLLAPVVVAVDALARSRRRRQRPGSWMTWLAIAALPFAVGLLVAHLLVLGRLAPEPSTAPVVPSLVPMGVRGLVALALTALVVAVAWVAGRPWLRGLADRTAGAGPVDAAAPGAAVVAALALCVCAVAIWAHNPYAGLLLAPLANLVPLAVLTPVRPRVGVALVLAGLAPLLGAAALYLERLSLNPLEGAWYWFGLVTGGHVSAAAMLLGCILLGTLASIGTILLARAGRPLAPAPMRRPLTSSRRFQASPPVRETASTRR